jgi:hypothetical protein
VIALQRYIVHAKTNQEATLMTKKELYRAAGGVTNPHDKESGKVLNNQVRVREGNQQGFATQHIEGPDEGEAFVEGPSHHHWVPLSDLELDK